MRMNTPGWDEYFLNIAEAVSLRSKDPKTQVGAVIVDNYSNHIVGTGYNGMPRGINDRDVHWDSPEKHDYVIHAEMNAISHCTQDLNGSQTYVIYCTLYPCLACAKTIAAAGSIIQVICPVGPSKDFQFKAEKLLKTAGIHSVYPKK